MAQGLNVTRARCVYLLEGKAHEGYTTRVTITTLRIIDSVTCHCTVGFNLHSFAGYKWPHTLRTHQYGSTNANKYPSYIIT